MVEGPVEKWCRCGALVWSGGLPRYTGTVICWQCGQDNSREPPLPLRVTFVSRLLRKRLRYYGWVGLRLRLRYLGWGKLFQLNPQQPELQWLWTWRGMDWADAWDMGRKRAREKARANLIAQGQPSR